MGVALGVPRTIKKEGLAATRKMQSLRGGPSYDYSYGQDLDPTEMQYLQEQALQESLRAGSFLGQSNYQIKQSYTQSYWKQYSRAGEGRKIQLDSW